MNRSDKTTTRSADTSAAALRALAAKYQDLLEEQRTRLARELHDELTQKLTVLSLELSLIEDSTSFASTQDPGLRAKIRELAELVTEMIQSVRKIKTELRPKLLDECGLAAAVEWEAQTFGKRTGCRIRLHVTEDLDLHGRIRTQMFRMFQAILSNVEKHADAHCVQIDLRRDRGAVLLRVSDDGRGLTAKQCRDPSALGFLELRERAAAVRGELQIHGKRGQGVVVVIRVPVTPADGTAPPSERNAR